MSGIVPGSEDMKITKICPLLWRVQVGEADRSQGWPFWYNTETAQHGGQEHGLWSWLPGFRFASGVEMVQRPPFGSLSE